MGTDDDEAAIADRVNAVLADPALAAQLGAAGRRRAVDAFSWASLAGQTVELYESLVGSGGSG